MTGVGILCRNPDRRGRAFAPGFRLGAPPRSRGFRSARAGGPGFRSRNPDPDFRDSGPKKSGFWARAGGQPEVRKPKTNSDSLAPGFRLDPDDPARAFRSGPSRTPAGHDRELGRRGWGGVTLSVHIGLTHGSPFK